MLETQESLGRYHHMQIKYSVGNALANGNVYIQHLIRTTLALGIYSPGPKSKINQMQIITRPTGRLSTLSLWPLGRIGLRGSLQSSVWAVDLPALRHQHPSPRDKRSVQRVGLILITPSWANSPLVAGLVNHLEVSGISGWHFLSRICS